MQKVYVVTGSTGEWSDRSEWTVKAFTTEEAVKSFVDEATKIANEQFLMVYPTDESEPDYDYDPVSALDPFFSMDYTGTSYSYSAVELVS